MTAPLSVLDRVGPFVVRDDVLPDAEARALLDWALDHQAFFAESRVHDGYYRPKIRHSRQLRDCDFTDWRQRLKHHFKPLVASLITDLGVTPFVVAHTELDLACHNDGDFYRRHIDMRTGPVDRQRRRVLSLVYYFNRVPAAFSGGALRLHAANRPLPDANGQNVPGSTDIAPLHNRLVAFPSWMPHEVLPVACPSGQFTDSRFSINCWFYATMPSASRDQS
ncbi:2OG-Fe(II) oxygenase [Sphingomonas sp. 28-63-12]|uniref:2OG-Fe(II) oxygenase n=1 Tax=Sphingomonas sp. 28-63-12 TaxID=1970434 RepID=UPI000BD401EB|nr:MAG: hypothetical protein B7Y47_12825 [Sphingomonas sp. 28-63-12]